MEDVIPVLDTVDVDVEVDADIDLADASISECDEFFADEHLPMKTR